MFCSEIVDNICDHVCERAKRPDSEENNSETGKNTSSILTQQVREFLLSLLTSGDQSLEAYLQELVRKREEGKKDDDCCKQTLF